MSILNYAPEGSTLRDCQVEALTQVEAKWGSSDVFILSVPTGAGKSHLAVSISNWVKSANLRAAIITPQVILQDQYEESFPYIPTLKGKARYSCKDKSVSNCEEMHSLAENYCIDCPYVKARQTIREASTGVYNLYSYMFDSANDKSYADIVIVDEAHAVVKQLQELFTLKLWKHIDNYPDSIGTQGDVVIWMEGYIRQLELLEKESSSKAKKLKYRSMIFKFTSLIRGIERDPGHFFYEKKMDTYKGVKKECIEIRPVTLEHTVGSLWKYHKKIVLMSGTIRPEDMEYLGLKRRRIAFIEVNSPIPPIQRPIEIMPIAQMSYQNQSVAIPKICTKIQELAEKHAGKGIIHITYGLIPEFKKHLKGDRYLWHTQDSKTKVYEKFRESTGNEILVAAGMAEGIDLVGEEYEWQVIAKIMFPSLMDALVQRQKEKEPKWYEWETIKNTVQQTGRICRSPTDFGVTYILDSSFVFLYRKSKMLFPKYFQEAVVFSQKGK